MSRLNLETLKTLSLLDTSGVSSSPTSTDQGEKAFGALLDRARSALNHPPTSTDHATASPSDSPSSAHDADSSCDDRTANDSTRDSASAKPAASRTARRGAHGSPASHASQSDDDTAAGAQDSADTTAGDSSKSADSTTRSTAATDASKDTKDGDSSASKEEPQPQESSPTTVADPQAAAAAAVAAVVVSVEAIPVATPAADGDVTAPAEAMPAPVGTSQAPPAPTLPPPMPAVPPPPPAEASSGASTDTTTPPSTGSAVASENTAPENATPTEQTPAAPVNEAGAELIAKVLQAQGKTQEQTDSRATDASEEDSSTPQTGKATGSKRGTTRTTGSTATTALAATAPDADATQAQVSDASQASSALALADAAPTPPVRDSEPQKGGSSDTPKTAVDPVQSNGSKATAPTSGPPDKQETGDSSQIDRVRFVQRVARAFESVGGGGGTVRLKLYPPELGALRMEVTVRNGVMTARVEAETTSAQSMLLENLPTLRERLAEQNIRVERFDVGLMDAGQGGMADQSNPQAQQPIPAPRGTSGRGQASRGAEAASTPRRAVGAGGVSRFDVTI